MPKWVCTAAAAAAWPVAMTIGIVLISPPAIALYDAGLLGTSPLAPMTFISVAVFGQSLLLSASVYAILHAYCDYDERREARRQAEVRAR